MPSGRTHDRITLWTLPLIAGLSWGLTRQSGMTLWICAGFLLGGLMLGPDLDTVSLPYKRWGWLRWIWLPYRNNLRHRSPWSHSPIVGTTVRVVYLMLWLSLLSWVGVAAINEVAQMGLSWEEVGGFWGRLLRQYYRESIALFVGLELGAFSHYTADSLVSTYKRVRSKGWQAVGRSATRRKPRRKTGRKTRRKSSSRSR